MLKKLIVFVTVCFFIFGCGNKSENSVGIINNDERIDSEENITTYLPISAKSYNNEGILIEYDLLEYNDKGNIIKDSLYSDTNKLKYYYIYGYDDNGNHLKDTCYTSDNKTMDYCIYEQGGTKKVYYSPDGTILWYSVSEHLSNGDLLKITSYSPNGTIDYIEEYIYNSNNKLEKVLSYDNNKNIEGYGICEYDNNGNVLKVSYYDNNNNLVESRVFDYKIYSLSITKLKNTKLILDLIKK